MTKFRNSRFVSDPGPGLWGFELRRSFGFRISSFFLPMPGSADFVQRFVHTLEAGERGPVDKTRARRAHDRGPRARLFAPRVPRARHLAGDGPGADRPRNGSRARLGDEFRAAPRRGATAGARGKRRPKIWVDTDNAPLPPLVDAIALLPVRGSLKMTPLEIVYVGDKTIVTLAMLFCITSVAGQFLRSLDFQK